MATRSSANLSQSMWRMIGMRTGADVPDCQLVDRFVHENDESAFSTLVQRHGPMVWGLCRRMLDDVHDAEDAFQATFLVFARKAESVGKRDLIGNWLYGVAYRTALKTRTRTAARRAQRRELVDMPQGELKDVCTWSETRRLLDDEVSRLPEKYRQAVVLCYFQGKAFSEAAQLLHCPVGTLSARVGRALEKLRRRLKGRNLAMSVAGLTMLLTQNAAPARVPEQLLVQTIQASTLFAAKNTAVAGVASLQVVSLAEGMLNAMGASKIKLMLMAFVMFATLVGSGAAMLINSAGAADPAPAAPMPLALGNLQFEPPEKAVSQPEPPEPAKKPAPDPAAIKEIAAIKQQILARRFKAFEDRLLGLAQRLEKSAKAEDREKAQVLRQTIKTANEAAVDVRFNRLVELLHKSKANSLQEVKEAIVQAELLAKGLRAMLDVLLNDRSAQLRAEQTRIENLLKAIVQVIRDQKIERTRTERGTADPKDLAEGQAKVTESTRQIAQSMKQASPPKPGNGDGGEPSGDPSRAKIEDAIKNQGNAEEKLKNKDAKEASNHQDKAIQDLEAAKKKLERILRQLRQEEIERTLALLQGRVEHMLKLQKEVRQGTAVIDEAIRQNPNKKPTRADEQQSLKLSDRESVIVQEATKAIALLEAEGTSVAFTEVFRQVLNDTVTVQRRLAVADVALLTQKIEQDIIETLEEMVGALKKARQMNEATIIDPADGGDSEPKAKKLIDMLVELRMIRAMQVRVNRRTEDYGKLYPGEQAGTPAIQKELRNLAGRQEKIGEITRDISAGENR